MISKKINILIFLFISINIYSQKKETIPVKKQDELFFYRDGNFKDTIITKGRSDIFFLKMSDDKKVTTEIKLVNASFIKTENENLYKLVYIPGMKYRIIFFSETTENFGAKNVSKITTWITDIAADGANNTNTKEIIIELWDKKTEKKILRNVFSYKEK